METDPRFTQEKQWLGTDYMQRQLANNPDNLLKRPGDGYYEQIIRGTGQRYLDGQSNDEEQFRMLMDNGVAFAQQYGLSAGVTLTASQTGSAGKDSSGDNLTLAAGNNLSARAADVAAGGVHGQCRRPQYRKRRKHAITPKAKQ